MFSARIGCWNGDSYETVDRHELKASTLECAIEEVQKIVSYKIGDYDIEAHLEDDTGNIVYTHVWNRSPELIEAKSAVDEWRRLEDELSKRVRLSFAWNGDAIQASQLFGYSPPVPEHMLSERMAVAAETLRGAVPSTSDPWVAAAAVRELERIRDARLAAEQELARLRLSQNKLGHPRVVVY